MADPMTPAPGAAAPLRVLVIAGSSRRETNCPAADSKASFLAQRLAERLPSDWTVDLFNLGNDYVLPKIQSCNACVSTSMALCVWPCNCYRRHSFFEPDLLWDEDLYGRLYAADAILFCAPVNWYSPTSSMKLLFDRLICANGGNPREELIRHKDGAAAAALEHSPRWRELSLNHLEGRTAAFFVYGDEGGDEIGLDGRPRILRHPEYFDPAGEEPLNAPARAYLPLVYQCRYSGIEAPAQLVAGLAFGKGGKYSDNQIRELRENREVLTAFDRWTDEAAAFIRAKGKVPASAYPVPLRSPDSALPPLVRQAQLLVRTVLGNLWLHSFGYFAARAAARRYRLVKE